jgi:hypothetical protein
MRSVDAAMTAGRTGLDSHVCLHELAARRDGEEWIAGRTHTGVFAGLPRSAPAARTCAACCSALRDATRLVTAGQ